MLEIKRLSLKEAKILLEGAELKAAEMKVPMCTAIADETGNMIAFTRMDDAKITSVDIAINKAFTAAAAKRATKDYNEIAVPGKPTFGIHTTNQSRFTIIGGGIPVFDGSAIVGSVGVSGGTAAEDETVAKAAIDYFNGKNK